MKAFAFEKFFRLFYTTGYRTSEEKEGDGAIGTTMRGIGPAYYDKMNRVTGIRVLDLVNSDVLADRLTGACTCRKPACHRIVLHRLGLDDSERHRATAHGAPHQSHAAYH